MQKGYIMIYQNFQIHTNNDGGTKIQNECRFQCCCCCAQQEWYEYFGIKFISVYFIPNSVYVCICGVGVDVSQVDLNLSILLIRIDRP